MTLWLMSEPKSPLEKVASTLGFSEVDVQRLLGDPAVALSPGSPPGIADLPPPPLPWGTGRGALSPLLMGGMKSGHVGPSLLAQEPLHSAGDEMFRGPNSPCPTHIPGYLQGSVKTGFQPTVALKAGK